MKKVLITGGHGFIGKSICKMLKEKFPDAVLSVPRSKELDLRNYERTRDYFERNSFDTVIHLAAVMAGIGELTQWPLRYFEENIQINFNTVKAALESGVKRFLTFGSSCAFSKYTPIPMGEEHLWSGQPENTYGTAKLMMLEHLQSQSEMEWLYLIPANVYGPGDHFDISLSHVIPATILKFHNAYKTEQREIKVWGDGLQIRDFIYIDDLTEIVCKLLNQNVWDLKILNLSTGLGTSIKRIVQKIQQLMTKGNEVKIQWVPSEATGILKKILKNESLLEIIGNYDFTDIEDGLYYTVREFLNDNNLNKLYCS